MAENQAEIADGQLVSGGFYNGLGVSPAAGRLIMDDDDRTGAAPVAVISYRYWQTPFRRQPRRSRTADPDQQHAFHHRRSFRARIFRREPGSGSQGISAVARRPFAGRESGRRGEEQVLRQNFYWLEMMGRLRPGVSCEPGAGRAGGPVPAIRGQHRSHCEGESGFAGAVAAGRRGRPGFAAAAVFQTALRPDGDGRPDSHHRVRQYRQSAAGALHGAAARDGGAPQPGRGTYARGAPVVDRERAAVTGWRTPRGACGTLGNPFDHLAAGQRTRQLHASRRPELAGAGLHPGPGAGDRAGLRSGSRHSGDEGGPDARAQRKRGRVGQRDRAVAWVADRPQPGAGGIADRHLACCW